MLPVKALRLELATALAADAATLAPPADANQVKLVAADFTPDENKVVADFTLATFTGSTPKAVGLGAQQVGVDPSTGLQSIALKEPAGGWRFQCTVAPGVPENIYGVILTNLAGTVLLAMQRFDLPITISEIGDFIEIGDLRFTFVLQPMS